MLMGGQRRPSAGSPPLKQFFLTVLGVFTGLVLFLVVAPVVLLTFAIAAGSSKPVTPAATVVARLRQPTFFD